MSNLSRKIVILFTLLLFLSAGLSPAPRPVIDNLKQKGTASSLLETAKAPPSAAVMTVTKSESSSGHNAWVLKQRPRGKRQSTSLATCPSSPYISAYPPPLLVAQELDPQMFSARQQPLLHYLRTIVLMI